MLNDPRSNYFKLSPAILEIREYRKFFAMVFIFGIGMYGVMFLNVETVHDVYFSITRFYKALLMVSLLSMLLLFFMRNVYRNRRMNKVILRTNLVLFILAFYLLRNQPFITDRQYIEAMIPQHSSAILTSRQASIENPQLQALADSIVQLQHQRIEKMKDMLSTMN